jgi:hypothetical protein
MPSNFCILTFHHFSKQVEFKLEIKKKKRNLSAFCTPYARKICSFSDLINILLIRKRYSSTFIFVK